jgi:hypothetical protein
MPDESPTGYVRASILLEPEVTRWLAFAIRELEDRAPRDALQFPPAVERTFETIKAFARREAERVARSASAFERLENPSTSVESRATVEPMTTAEAMRELELESTQRVTQLIDAGRLVATKHGRRWSIDRGSVEAEKARRVEAC